MKVTSTRHRKKHYERFRQKQKEFAATYKEQAVKNTQKYNVKNPFRLRVARMWRTAIKHSIEEDNHPLDFATRDIAYLLRDALDKGHVTLSTYSPRSASLDKIDVTNPISLSNIQIVPHWYNRAKSGWNETDFIAAMADYGFVRKP
jgi:hypothetical protein